MVFDVLVSLFRTIGGACLCYACEKGSLRFVRLLISAGADLNQFRRTGQFYATPLILAVLGRNQPMAQCLIEAGAAVNLPGFHGESLGPATPLMVAALHGLVEIAQLLIEAGADCNSTMDKGYTACHFAVKAGQLGAVRCLLEGGAEVDSMTDDGMTPLGMAAELGFLQILQLLIDAGADVEHTTEWDGKRYSPLCYAAFRGHSECVQRLQSVGANKDAPLNEFMTPLFLAITAGRLGVVRVLLEAGAAAEITTASGQRVTALWFAADAGHASIVRLLVESDAGVDRADRLNSALPVAASRGHTEVVEYLLSVGAVNVVEQV